MSAEQRDEREQAEMEKLLGRLVPDPALPGLRERVLGAAVGARRSAALTPGLRRLAVACSIVIIAVAVAGPLVGKHEAERLAAVLDGRSRASRAESPEPEFAELLGGDERGANRLAVLQAFAASAARADRPTKLVEAFERLKGWLNDETLEDPD